jgi:hypothetical protein
LQIRSSDKISIAGFKYNEDVADIVRNAAWVIDAATGLGSDNYMPAESDGKWYAEMWDKYLLNNISDVDKSLKDIVLAGLDYIEGKYNNITQNKEVKPINMPSAGIVLVRWNEKELEYFILGDCQLWVRDSSGVRIIADYKLERFDKEALNAMQKYIDQGYTLERARESIKHMLVENRLKTNKIDGYWSLSFSREAVCNSLSDVVLFDNENKMIDFLLSSDGFYAITDKYKKMNEAEVFDYAHNQGLKALCDHIRQIEEGDPEAKKYVRFKKSDDASAVFLSFNESGAELY